MYLALSSSMVTIFFLKQRVQIPTWYMNLVTGLEAERRDRGRESGR